jgi:hypothetical protein
MAAIGTLQIEAANATMASKTASCSLSSNCVSASATRRSASFAGNGSAVTSPPGADAASSLGDGPVARIKDA